MGRECGGFRAGLGTRPRSICLFTPPPPFPCLPPTGCYHTGWAVGLPRAARRRSTGPAGRPRRRGPRQARPPPQLWCWSLCPPLPLCRWPPHQDRWLGFQEPGACRRPGAAAGPGLTGRPRPAEPSGRPAGPPAVPAAAVGVAAVAGGPSRLGHPGPAEGRWAGGNMQTPGRDPGWGLMDRLGTEVRVEPGRYQQRDPGWEEGLRESLQPRGKRSMDQGLGETDWGEDVGWGKGSRCGIVGGYRMPSHRRQPLPHPLHPLHSHRPTGAPAPPSAWTLDHGPAGRQRLLTCWTILATSNWFWSSTASPEKRWARAVACPLQTASR